MLVFGCLSSGFILLLYRKQKGFVFINSVLHMEFGTSATEKIEVPLHQHFGLLRSTFMGLHSSKQ